MKLERDSRNIIIYVQSFLILISVFITFITSKRYNNIIKIQYEIIDRQDSLIDVQDSLINEILKEG